MALDVTKPDEAVAIYDKVTGIPLEIEVFGSEELAEDFLAWCTAHDHHHLAAMTWVEVCEVRKQWQTERVDPESGYIREDAEELTTG